MGEAVPWRRAMADALYGADGFFTRTNQPGGSGAHFRTSARASELFATAIMRVVVAADEALGGPDPFDVVDVVRITRMLKRATKPVSPAQADGKVVQLPLPRFARPEQHFETRATTKKKEEGL